MKKRKKDYSNSKITRRVISITLLVIWTLFIFKNSSETAAVSSVRSGAITAFLGNIVSEKFIRKMAHLIEYAVLGFLICNVMHSFDYINKKGTIIALVSGFVIASADELIQLTSDGRSPQFSDVCIDFCGVLLGYIFLRIILILIMKISKSKMNAVDNK